MTLVVFVLVAVVIGLASYVSNAGFGDRRPTDRSSTGDDGGPWSTPATPLDAVRPGNTLRISGRVEAVLQPFGSTSFSHRWTARILPGDAGGTRARFVVGDERGHLTVEIPHGSVETSVRFESGWTAMPARIPALTAGVPVDVYGTARLQPSGMREAESELVLVARYVSGDPPPSR